MFSLKHSNLDDSLFCEILYDFLCKHEIFLITDEIFIYNFMHIE